MLKNKPNKKILEIKDSSKDSFILADKSFELGLLLGKEYGDKLSGKLDELVKEYSSLESDEKKQRVFKRALNHGVLKYLTSKLNIDPMRDYFRELEAKQYLSPIGGLREVQQVLKKRTKKMWDKLKSL